MEGKKTRVKKKASDPLLISDDILLAAMSYVDEPTLREMGKVCTRWRTLACTPSLWRDYFVARALRWLYGGGVNLAKLAKLLRKGAVLSGGMAVCALDQLMGIYTVGDIDIFVLNADISLFKACLADIAPGYATFAYKAYTRCGGTISIRMADLLDIQVILSPAKTIHELLCSFDLDYVQCALYWDNTDNKVNYYMTSDCANAFRTRTITSILDRTYCPAHLAMRIMKARKRGFNLPPNIERVGQITRKFFQNPEYGDLLIDEASTRYADRHSKAPVKHECTTLEEAIAVKPLEPFTALGVYEDSFDPTETTLDRIHL